MSFFPHAGPPVIFQSRPKSSVNSAVLRGDHHCDIVLWSRWSELGGAARDVVDVVGARRSCSGRGRRDLWSELDGAARDMVDVACRQLDVGSDGSLGV